MKSKQDIILNFIKQFRDLGAAGCFSNGMCYYFSLILRRRFKPFETTILYDEIINHFATKIDGRIYDITGDITDDSQYHWKRWSSINAEDPKLYERICRDCIDKVPSGILLCKYCENCFYDEVLNIHLCGLDNAPVDLDTPCAKGVERE